MTTLLEYGHRSVPVELGDSYLSRNASQKVITLRKFFESYIRRDLSDESDADAHDSSNHVLPNDLDIEVNAVNNPHDLRLKDHIEIGYIAQHRLFDQIPELRQDFVVPQYCSMSSIDDFQGLKMVNNIDQNEDPRNYDDIKVQMWMGPIGTVRPSFASVLLLLTCCH
jgi:lysine-specific demethylase 8